MAVFPLTDKRPIEVGKPKLELVNNPKSWFRSIGTSLFSSFQSGFSAECSLAQ